jgi:hypothetical protein
MQMDGFGNTTKAPLSTLVSTRFMQESPGRAEGEFRDRQRPLTESVLASGDAHEGERAFAGKRAPDRNGR